MTVVRRAVFVLGYLFVAVGLLVGLGLAAILGAVRLPPARRERWIEAFIHGACTVFVRGLRAGGALELELSGSEILRAHPGAIIIANHPTFLDAIFVFSFVPRSFCVVKPTVMSNPLLARTARSAGFLTADRPRALVGEAARRLAAGRSMIVFPEGTRSVGGILQPFQPGFALVAVHSRAPVITLHVTSGNGRWLQKGTPVIDFTPALPVRYRFEVGGIFTPSPDERASDFLARVEQAFRQRQGAADPVVA